MEKRTTTIKVDIKLWSYIKDNRKIDETMNDTLYRLLELKQE